MEPKFKQLTDFLISIGVDQIEHTDKGYLAHAIGVHNDLRDWGCDSDLCRAAMFHSITARNSSKASRCRSNAAEKYEI